VLQKGKEKYEELKINSQYEQRLVFGRETDVEENEDRRD
jgi:hypothetical protein